MRRLKLFLLLSCAVVNVHNVADAKSKRSSVQARRTVRDYYLRLPSNYFLESPSENLRKRPMVVDIPNNYIETSGEAGQPYLLTSLFRHRETELFAVYAPEKTGNVLKFYRLSGGRLRDVTRQVWRVKPRANDRVYLPRYGTNILIMDETYPGDEKTRLIMKWRNGRFVK